MNVAGYILAALRDQGVSHVFMDPGGLMVTALAGAGADRSPVLAISGEVPRALEGLGAFQDASGAAVDDVRTRVQWPEMTGAEPFGTAR
jgi:thiamine pyrophosphate-dependent acetolactate synthase large subunit-like protein